MKAKKSLDKSITIPGYVIDIDKQNGYLSIRTGYGDQDYRLPDGYVCLTLNDDMGNEFYVLCHKDTYVGLDTGNRE